MSVGGKGKLRNECTKVRNQHNPRTQKPKAYLHVYLLRAEKALHNLRLNPEVSSVVENNERAEKRGKKVVNITRERE